MADLGTARQVAATYWRDKGVEQLATAIIEGRCDDTIEVQVALAAIGASARPSDIILAAEDYMNAVQDLGEHDPVSKLTYFEESPSRNGECLWRWQQLDSTGKALRDAISTATGAKP